MNSLQRLIAGLMLAALAGVLLFLPRNVPFGRRYPFVFGDSLALKFSVDTQQLAIEVGAVVLIGGALYLILGRMR